MWNLHTTQPQYFVPTHSEVVNLTGLAENKGLDVSYGKRCFFAVNEKNSVCRNELVFTVGCLTI
jgi:hypothetical protein